MTMNTGDVQPIEQVRAGMHVLDADGAEIGTVEDVVMGDPEAETAPDEPSPAGMAFAGPAGAIPVAAPIGMLGGLVSGDLGADLPDVERARLLRTGYLRINLKGPFSGHRFAASDEVAEVAGDEVHLSVPSARLVG